MFPVTITGNSQSVLPATAKVEGMNIIEKIAFAL
jgi:hypothetical protein